ncbi:putative disease resistance protein RGA4 [Cornus florida]|uniref:putative disease resistance protein RGA4 n=1 Tax=Cornus florida TaxID=4283 RepID=UPI00289A7B07|nr:putative disease resistance protein RGA4 [Cornus florida]
MPAWEEWSCSMGVEEHGRQFPCLHELKIVGCPKLITVSLLSLPSLQKLDLVNYQELLLKSIVDVTSLTSLKVDRIIGLSYLEEAWVQSLGALESLEFRECNQPTALWQNGRGVTENATQKNNLVGLRRVHVESCPQLVSFGERLDEEGPPCINLQEIYIGYCENFEKLPNELNNLASLTSLEISGCSKFVRFPKEGVPPTLKYLSIHRCKALESLPDGDQLLPIIEVLAHQHVTYRPQDALYL